MTRKARLRVRNIAEACAVECPICGAKKGKPCRGLPPGLAVHYARAVDWERSLS